MTTLCHPLSSALCHLELVRMKTKQASTGRNGLIQVKKIKTWQLHAAMPITLNLFACVDVYVTGYIM